MSDHGAPEAPLQVRSIGLDVPGAAPLCGFSADFVPGLALLIDEEGEAKTPLLRLLAGEQAPGAGTVRWRGRDVAALPAAERAAQVFWRDPRREWPEVSPAQWARESSVRHPAWNEAAWQEHVQGLGLAEHLHKEMFRLSTGSKRKVLLAAALASGAPLTLVDEPEAALDWASIRYLRGALAGAARRSGETGRVFVVAHYEPVPEVPWGQVVRL